MIIVFIAGHHNIGMTIAIDICDHGHFHASAAGDAVCGQRLAIATAKDPKPALIPVDNFRNAITVEVERAGATAARLRVLNRLAPEQSRPWPPTASRRCRAPTLESISEVPASCCQAEVDLTIAVKVCNDRGSAPSSLGQAIGAKQRASRAVVVHTYNLVVARGLHQQQVRIPIAIKVRHLCIKWLLGKLRRSLVCAGLSVINAVTGHNFGDTIPI